LILANTGIRFGECRQLLWRNVSIFTEDKDIKSKIMIEVGKTGRRTVIGRRGKLFKDLKSSSPWKKKDDVVFADQKSGEQFPKKTYYKYWNEVIENTSLKNKQPKPVFYCLRHTYATMRLYEDVPEYDLSKNMGCDVKFIESHYGHVQQEKKSKVLTQTKKSDESSKVLLEL
jgi:integrase